MICVAIPCLPRSGSSMIAGMIARLGFDMGPQGPKRPTHSENPLGFYEDWRFLQFHRWFSARANLDDTNGFRARLRMPPRDPAFVPDETDRYQRIVAACEAGGKDWGIKDPELTYYFPRFVATVTCEIRVVIPDRPIDKVAASLHRHWRPFGIAAEEAWRATGEYAETLDGLVASWNGPLLRIDYLRCLSEPREQARELAHFLDAEYTDAAADFVRMRPAGRPLP